MKTLVINEKGIDFISFRKKKINQFVYIFPILVLFSLGAGIIKLGFSSYSIVVFLLTIPVLGIVLYKGVFEPKKIIANLIVKIEISESDTLFFNEVTSIKSKNIKKKNGLNIFESSFPKYYIVLFNSKEYYIIPDFFDNIEMFEKELNLV